MGDMEISNPYGVLAESQHQDLQDGVSSIIVEEKDVEIATKNNSAENRMNLKKVDGHVNSSTKNGSDANQAAETIEKKVNWADQVEAAEKDEDPTPLIQVKKRKASPPKSQPTKVAKSDSSAPKPAGKTRVFNRNPVAAIKNTRQQQQINKARYAAASFDQGCFIEWCPDFDHLSYMRALEEKLGRGSVFQLMRMSGHMLASLSSVEKAERLIEDGLTIGDTILRAFPYRKRAEKIIIGNLLKKRLRKPTLPIAVKEEDIVATLRPYCKVVSLAFEIVNCEGYSWATGNREAFILMNDGMKLHQLPGAASKGETTPTFITHGVKCSMCHRQGHRRASCPRRDREERPTHQQTPRQDPARLPPTTQSPSSAALAVTPPAAVGRPQETPSKSVSAPAASTPVQPTPATSASKSPAEGVSFSSKVSEVKLAVPALPLPSVPRVQEESSREEETTKKVSLALEQLRPVLERLPDTIFKDIETAVVGRGRVIQAITNKGPMKELIAALNSEQAACLTDLTTGMILNKNVMSFRMACLNVRGIAVRERSVELCCFLKQHAVDVAFVQETNVLVLNNVRDLCLGYSAVFAPLSTPRGSGLAVIVAPGVTVLWHRVLWPGKIAIASVKIRGLETRVINCHLSHTPEERHLQLQIIAEEAIREDDGPSATSTSPRSLRATSGLEPWKPSRNSWTGPPSYGSRVDAARLDRVLIPSRLSGRVTRYWTLNYRNSDHGAILLQVGDPPSPSAPSISALLRSAPVIERIEALLSEASQEIEGIPTDTLLDSARLQAFPTAELAVRWTPTVDVPRSIPWADLRRNCFSGHDADVALRLALHALPHPDHPASRRANCAACGSSDGSLAHRYWSCRAVRPLLREVFASCEVPLDLQAWLFGVGLHPEAVKLTSVAKATIYKYHLGLELGNASQHIDLPTLWERTLATALRGGLNAYSWLAVSGTWLTPPTSGTWHPPRRRRLLKLWEAVSEILELNHRVLPPHQLQELHIIGDSRFLRPPDLLVASRWAGMRVGDLTSSSSLPLRTTRAALADIAALTTFCNRIVEENRNHTHRVDNIKDGIVLRGTTTAFQRLTTRTARRMLERPRLAALPITQLLARWLPHVSIPISISWPSLRRGAFSGHNADVAVRLALHALPHPAHPASARESCIACGSEDLSLAHRYWSCGRIRPVILEAFTIIQRPPDLQGWIFGHDLEDDALAILASAKTRIYKHFLGLEIRGVQEDPLIVWRRTLARWKKHPHTDNTPNPPTPNPRKPIVFTALDLPEHLPITPAFCIDKIYRSSFISHSTSLPLPPYSPDIPLDLAPLPSTFRLPQLEFETVSSTPTVFSVGPEPRCPSLHRDVAWGTTGSLPSLI
ncbi:hypothetical protein LAZ67_4003492 [Cordylochernes scorpioides]|uniref:Uncharacterized protein n=1 Tax=Cordylochernes scorpioides TaxID=51811 RepID=A0ABY6KDR4_9ARAC|nr:hypothetical protein LAZ67_4003492 [Cordylochernes scorpioides]